MSKISQVINMDDYDLVHDDDLYINSKNKHRNEEKVNDCLKYDDFNKMKHNHNQSKKIQKKIKTGKEATYIKKILKNFDYESSNTWKKIQELFSTGIRHSELISIAEILIYLFGVPNISRSCHRSFPVLIKWFDDNWEIIEPHIYNISLLDEDKKQINLSRQIYDQIK